MSENLNNPNVIAEKGKEIYNSKYREEYENKYPNKFVAVNVLDQTTVLGDTASSALLEAKRQKPQGLFYLIRVGHAAAFEVGFGLRSVNSNRLHR